MDDLEEKFDQIANRFLNDSELLVNGHVLQITEASFHFHSAEHPDPWVYKIPGQLEFEKWHVYFRDKKRDQPMLEWVFGDSNSKTSAGMLVRSIHVGDIAKTGDLVPGPVKVVERINELLGRDLLEGVLNSKTIEESGLFQFRPRQKNSERSHLYKAPRKNLFWNKSADLLTKAKYKMKPYRYFTWPEHVFDNYRERENAPLLWLSLHNSGECKKLPRDFRSQSYLDAYSSGRAMKLKDFHEISENDRGIQECKLMGAWDSYRGYTPKG